MQETTQKEPGAAEVPSRPSTVLEYAQPILTPDDHNVLQRFWKEWLYMHNARNNHVDEWKLWENQFDASIAPSAAMNMKGAIKDEIKSSPSMVLLQTDRNVLEQQLGEEGFKIPFKVEPVGKETDSKALDVSRHTLDYFLKAEDVIDELVDFRWDRGRSGTGILYNGIWATRTVNNRPLDGDTSGTKFKQEVSVTYHIGIKNISVWDFWVDERATRWKDATRCVWRETLDIQEFRANYAGRPGFKYVDAVQPVKQDFMSPEQYNFDDTTLVGEMRQVYLFHYFNRVTGEYWVIANRAWPIYVGWNILKDSQLPFELCQMGKRRNTIWGLGVGGRTQSFLAYMNNLFGMAFDKAMLSSNPPIILGGGGTLDGEIYSGGSELTTLNFSGDAKNMQQMQVDGSIAIHQALIDMATGQIVQNTGVNPLEYNKPLSGINPFVAGIQEQARKAKTALTQAMYDIAVGKALTKMLWLLMRFGPQLYADKMEKIVEGKPMKSVKWLNVKVEGHEVTRQDGIQSFEKSPSSYGYFEFKPDLFKGKDGEYYDMAVTVTTPTTETMLNALKKNDAQEFIKSVQTIQAMFPNEPMPVTPEELYEISAEAYQYDPEGLFSKTSDRKAREENAQLNKAVLAMNPDKVERQAGVLPELPGAGAPAMPTGNVAALPPMQSAPMK